MFLSHFKRMAEIVGLACFALLAVYGAVTILCGDPASAANSHSAQAAPTASGATVPMVMNYQGTLYDTAGNPLNGTYTLTFRIYGSVVDPIANALWSEVHTGVIVRSGLFNVSLGDISPIAPTLFTSPDRFIGVTVHPFEELLPRQRFASVPYAFSAYVPAGTIVAFAGTNIPDGWLPCNGGLVNRLLYPALFSAISTAWGAGDGTTNFNLPDLRGRGPVGVGQGAGLTSRGLAQLGGEENHTLSVAEMPAHTHRYDYGGVAGINFAEVSQGHGSSPETSSTGGSQPHNNMQPFAIVNFIIKY